MKVGQGVGQPGDRDQIGRHGFPLPLGRVVENPGSGGARIEMDLVASDAEGFLSGPVIKIDHGWSRRQAALDQAGSETDSLGLIVDLLAGVAEQGPGFRILEKDSGPLQDRKRLVDDPVDQGGGEEVELRAQAGNHDVTFPIKPRAALTAAGALSPYPSAPISSAHLRDVGAPPTRTLNRPRRPRSTSSSMSRR